MFQRNTRVASATETSADARAVTDIKKNYDSIYTINGPNLYNQVRNHTLFRIFFNKFYITNSN